MGEEQPEMKMTRGTVILLILWFLGGIWYVYSGASNIEALTWMFRLGARGVDLLVLILDVILFGALLVNGIAMLLQLYFVCRQKKLHDSAYVNAGLPIFIFIFHHVLWLVLILLSANILNFAFYANLNYWIFFFLELLIALGVLKLVWEMGKRKLIPDV